MTISQLAVYDQIKTQLLKTDFFEDDTVRLGGRRLSPAKCTFPFAPFL